MRFSNTGWPQKTDVVSMLHPSHVTQPEHLLPGHTALEAKVKSVNRLFRGECGSFAAQQGLFLNTEPLFFQQEKLHALQRRQVVFAGVYGIEINRLDAEVGQKV